MLIDGVGSLGIGRRTVVLSIQKTACQGDILGAVAVGEVQAMLSRSPEPVAEEWRIDDREGFGGIRLSEWASFDEVHGIALLIEDDEVFMLSDYAPISFDSRYFGPIRTDDVVGVYSAAF